MENKSEVLIKPVFGWPNPNIRELYEYREVLYFLIWRDFKARYKQSFFGVAWSIVPPFFQMIVFSVLFGKVGKMDSQGFSYPVFVYAGLIPWTFFSKTVMQGALSLVSQQHLITKIYFPRIFVPTAAAGVATIDYVLGILVYFGVLVIYGVIPSSSIWLLPLLFLITAMAALGLSYTLAALTVSYRDFSHIIPITIQMMMWISPVVYPLTLIPERYTWFCGLNPMMGLIDAHRAVILGTPLNWQVFTTSLCMTFALLIFGVKYFSKTESLFADVA